MRQKALEDGLGEIQIIRQTQTGQTKKLNITETAFQILQASITQEGRLDTQAKQEIQNLSITDIEFPPIPEDQLRTFQTQNKSAIAEYFQNIYNILNVEYNGVTVKNIGEEAINNKNNAKRLKELHHANRKMYFDLMNLNVPKDVTSVHKAYIRITQLHHHFIAELRNSSQDPLGLKTNYILTVQILEELQPKLKAEISEEKNTHDLQIKNKALQSSSSSETSSQSD